MSTILSNYAARNSAHVKQPALLYCMDPGNRLGIAKCNIVEVVSGLYHKSGSENLTHRKQSLSIIIGPFTFPPLIPKMAAVMPAITQQNGGSIRYF